MSARWTLIQSVLDAKLQAFPGLNPSLVAWPNRKFDKPNPPVIYLKVDLIRSGVDAASGKGGSTHEKGIYQVSIVAPANDPNGAVPSSQKVDAIVDHFDRVQLTGTGLVLQCGVPEPGSTLQEPDWTTTPVSITFVAL